MALGGGDPEVCGCSGDRQAVPWGSRQLVQAGLRVGWGWGRRAAEPVCADAAAAFPQVYRSGRSTGSGGVPRLAPCSPFPSTPDGVRGQRKISGCRAARPCRAIFRQ